MRKGNRSWPGFAPYIVLAVLVCVFLSPALFGGRVLLPGSFLGRMSPWNAYPQETDGVYWEPLTWDDAAIFYPSRALFSQGIRSGELPLWNPYQFCGQPLLADGQSGVLYPPNWLFGVLSAERAVGVLAGLHLFAAGIFTYIFLRGLGLRSASSMLGGIAFMLSGWAVTWLQAPAFLSAGAWLPLSLHLSRLAHERRSIYLAAGVGGSLALSLLGGHPQISFYVLLGVGLFWLYLIIRSRRESPVLRGVLLGTMALGLALMLAAPQLLPMQEFAAMSHRAQQAPSAEGYAGYSRLAMPFGHLITLLVPDFFGNPSRGTYWGANEYPEYCAYIGILSLLLLPLAFLRGSRSGYTWFFAGLAALALLMALGTAVNRGFYFGVPGFTKSGSPARVLFLFVFSVSTLVGMGADRLLADIESKSPLALRRTLVIPLALLALGALLMLVVYADVADRVSLGDLVAQTLTESRYFFTFLIAAALLTALLVSGRMSRRMGIPLLLGILAADLVAFGMWYNPTCARDEVFPPTALTDFLKSDAGFTRIAPLNSRWSIPDFPRDVVLPPNTASVYNLFDVQGYNSLYQIRYKKLLDSAAGGESCPPENGNMLFARNPDSPVYDLLGVRWFISPYRLAETDREIDGCYLHRNPNALPRAFLVRETRVVDDEEALRLISEGGVDLRKTALLSPEDDAALSPWKRLRVRLDAGVKEDEVRLVRYTLNTVTLKVRASRPGVVVLTDQYFPGWKAEVDGRESPVIRANYAFRAAPVDRGEHTVVFFFEPRSLRVGYSAAIVALLGLTVLCVAGVIKKRSE